MEIIRRLFEKLRKATITFVISVNMEQLGGCHWMDLNGIWYVSIFFKICRVTARFISN